MSLRAVVFSLQCLFVLAAAMFFDLGELEERCIIEEIPIDTLVTGKSFKKNYISPSSSHVAHFEMSVVLIWKRLSSKSLFNDQVRRFDERSFTLNYTAARHELNKDPVTVIAWMDELMSLTCRLLFAWALAEAINLLPSSWSHCDSERSKPWGSALKGELYHRAEATQT